MTRVEISRAKWGRGESEGSALKRADNGLMCCLGFICKLAGISDETITNMGYPNNLFKEETAIVKPFSSGLTFVKGPLFGQPVPEILVPFIEGDAGNAPAWVSRLARINDDISISDERREAELTRVAAEHGFEFVFVE